METQLSHVRIPAVIETEYILFLVTFSKTQTKTDMVFILNLFSLDAYPWQISLQMRQLGIFSHICGGSVIDEHTIVCAAHCVIGEVEEQVQVIT